MCVTTDKASNNGTFMEELVERTCLWDCPFDMDGWINCMCHVINLAVQDALQEVNHLIDKVSAH